MKPNTTLVTIPALSDSTTLAKFQTPGDPVVIVKMTSVGNNQPYTHRAGDKSFIFRWATEQQGHILRVPLALWMQNKAKLAHELLDQRQSSRSLIVLFEMPAVETVVTEFLAQSFSKSPEMGAADTPPAQNVVGLSEEPTAAPAVGEWHQPKEDTVYKALCDDGGDSESTPDNHSVGGVDLRSGITAATETAQDADAAALSDLAYDSCDTPKRIKALAALLGVEESALREAIDSSSSRVELAAAGWVRRKESQPA